MFGVHGAVDTEKVLIFAFVRQNYVHLVPTHIAELIASFAIVPTRTKLAKFTAAKGLLELIRIVDHVENESEIGFLRDKLLFMKYLVKKRTVNGHQLCELAQQQLMGLKCSLSYKAKQSRNLLYWDDAVGDHLRKYEKIVMLDWPKQIEEMIAILEDHLQRNTNNDEYEKNLSRITRSYYRLILEYWKRGSSVHATAGKRWDKLVRKEMQIVEQQLDALNPRRLEIALDLSVRFYEILCDKQKAIDFAQKAVDDATDATGDTILGWNTAEFKGLQSLKNQIAEWTN